MRKEKKVVKKKANQKNSLPLLYSLATTMSDQKLTFAEEPPQVSQQKQALHTWIRFHHHAEAHLSRLDAGGTLPARGPARFQAQK
jgi:hypothetical protein